LQERPVLSDKELSIKWASVPFSWEIPDLLRAKNVDNLNYRLTGVVLKAKGRDPEFESIAHISDRVIHCFNDQLRKWIRREAHPVTLIYELRTGKPVLPEVNT